MVPGYEVSVGEAVSASPAHCMSGGGISLFITLTLNLTALKSVTRSPQDKAVPAAGATMSEALGSPEQAQSTAGQMRTPHTLNLKPYNGIMPCC